MSGRTSWELPSLPVNHKAEFQQQFELTVEGAKKMRKYVQELEEELKKHTGKPDDDKLVGTQGKLLFLKQQDRAWKFAADTLLKVKFTIEKAHVDSEVSDKEADDHAEFFKQGVELLKMIATSFKDVEDKDSSAFVRFCRNFKGIFQNHPRTIGSGVAGFALWGCVYSTGWLGNWHLIHGLLNATWLGAAFLTWKFALAMAVGSLGFGLLLAGCIGLIEYGSFLWNEACTDEHQLQRDRLIKQLDSLQNATVPLQEMSDLRQAYEKTFVHAIAEPSADDKCIVCQEAFPNGPCGVCGVVDEQLRAERSPGCDGAHFLHQKCLREWTKKSGSFECTVCRQ